MNAPLVRVGILTNKTVSMNFRGEYAIGDKTITGRVTLTAANQSKPLIYTPCTEDASVEIDDVTIGINFHWQRNEVQRFKGQIMILPHDGKLTVINIISVEDYLESVISSEMKATSDLELLKAHAVISRSWVLAQIQGKKNGASESHSGGEVSATRIIRWYGHADHTLFDVCADDHCQRYYGITRQTTAAVAQAVKATAGEVLRYEGELCDTRFSKCCGGVFEEFETCWEQQHKPYLIAQRDSKSETNIPDLTIEENARKWILSKPYSFCNTSDKAVLMQVLNGYDFETTPDFYRWTVEYTTAELTSLIARKSGIDFGNIIDIVPLTRGKSGRLITIKIIGDKREMEIGKELEIRRILSESHLFSSAFIVEKTAEGFKLHGAGWGHGVGLCQIGAAVMAQSGYDYREILSHYYPGSNIEKI